MTTVKKLSDSVTSKDDDKVWSDVSLYFVTEDTADTQCIAPTLKKSRCRWSASADVLKLHEGILELEHETDVVEQMLRLVALRCCTRGTHQEKLKARPKCRRALAELYLRKYVEKELLSIPVNRDLVVEVPDSIMPGQLEPFVPKEEQTIKTVLMQKLEKKNGSAMSLHGVVYGFTSSAWPDVVKIGFSTDSAAARMGRYADCMPNGKIVVEQRFAFPERMEQLIHVELNSQRRKVVRCKTCNCGHQEFFELPADEVRVLINEWRDLIDSEPLYDTTTLMLTSTWEKRVQSVKLALTVFELRKLLLKERTKTVAVKIENEVVSLERVDQVVDMKGEGSCETEVQGIWRLEPRVEVEAKGICEAMASVALRPCHSAVVKKEVDEEHALALTVTIRPLSEVADSTLSDRTTYVESELAAAA